MTETRRNFLVRLPQQAGGGRFSYNLVYEKPVLTIIQEICNSKNLNPSNYGLRQDLNVVLPFKQATARENMVLELYEMENPRLDGNITIAAASTGTTTVSKTEKDIMEHFGLAEDQE